MSLQDLAQNEIRKNLPAIRQHWRWAAALLVVGFGIGGGGVTLWSKNTVEAAHEQRDLLRTEADTYKGCLATGVMVPLCAGVAKSAPSSPPQPSQPGSVHVASEADCPRGYTYFGKLTTEGGIAGINIPDGAHICFVDATTRGAETGVIVRPKE